MVVELFKKNLGREKFERGKSSLNITEQHVWYRGAVKANAIFVTKKSFITSVGSSVEFKEVWFLEKVTFKELLYEFFMDYF